MLFFAQSIGIQCGGIYERKDRHQSLQSVSTCRAQILGGHFWSRGYCVSTVGIDEERIRQYVKWQEKQEK